MGEGISGGGGGLVASSGSYTTTATGITETAREWTVTWERIGRLLLLEITGSFSGGTSNATSFLFPGPAPVEIRPVTTAVRPSPAGTLLNNGVIEPGLQAVMELDGSITWYRNGSSSGWTNTGTKGFGANPSFTVFLAD